MMKMRKPKTYKGQAILDSKIVTNDEIQEENELVVVGRDVEGLYPAIVDVEAAILCYNAVMESQIKFTNMNYRKGRMYITKHLTPESTSNKNS